MLKVKKGARLPSETESGLRTRCSGLRLFPFSTVTETETQGGLGETGQTQLSRSSSSVSIQLFLFSEFVIYL